MKTGGTPLFSKEGSGEIRYVYLNGRVTPLSNAKVSVDDRGLLYGDGVFETLKFSNNSPEHIDEHMERLSKNLAFIGIPARRVKGLVSDIRGGIIGRLVEKNRLTGVNAYVRITVTRGRDNGGLAPGRGISPTCLIVVKAIDDKLMARLQKNGVKAITLSGYARTLASIKSLNFLPNVLGKMEAGRAGAYEGIFAGKDGFVTEGTSTNLFIVKKRLLMTPPASGGAGKEEADSSLRSEAGSSPSLRSGLRLTRSDGALPGVMRRAVIKTAKTLGIPFREKRISKKELMACDEAFLTNSVIGAVPLIKIDGRAIGGGSPGNITRMIQINLLG